MIEGGTLAGGRSQRFGRNKAFVTLAGKSLLLHVLEGAMNLAQEVVVAIGREDNVASYASIVRESVRVLNDTMREKSPLVGIVTAFQVMNSEYSLVLSCDTPLVNQRVLGLLFERTTGSDAAIPRWPDGEIEPLQSVYRVAPALPAAVLALGQHRFRNVNMIQRLGKVTYLPVEDIKHFDSSLTTFFNVNIESDLRQAEKIRGFN